MNRAVPLVGFLVVLAQLLPEAADAQGFVRFYALPGTSDIGLPGVWALREDTATGAFVREPCSAESFPARRESPCSPQRMDDNRGEGMAVQFASPSGMRTFELMFGDSAVHVPIQIAAGQIALVRIETYLAPTNWESQPGRGSGGYRIGRRILNWRIAISNQLLPASPDSLSSPLLQRHLRDGDWGTRWRAARSLLRLGPPVDSLGRALHEAVAVDRDARVRNVALARSSAAGTLSEGGPTARNVLRIRRPHDSIPVIGMLTDRRGRPQPGERIRVVPVDASRRPIKVEVLDSFGWARPARSTFSCRITRSGSVAPPPSDVITSEGILLRSDMRTMLTAGARFDALTDEAGRFVVMIPRELCIFTGPSIERLVTLRPELIVTDGNDAPLTLAGDTARFSVTSPSAGVDVGAITREGKSLTAAAPPHVVPDAAPEPRYWSDITRLAEGAVAAACVDHSSLRTSALRLGRDSSAMGEFTALLLDMKVELGRAQAIATMAEVRALAPPPAYARDHAAIVEAVEGLRDAYATASRPQGGSYNGDALRRASTAMREQVLKYALARRNLASSLSDRGIDVPGLRCAGLLE